MSLEPSKDLEAAMERLEVEAADLEGAALEAQTVAAGLPTFSGSRARRLRDRAGDCARRAADIRTVLNALKEAMK